jgi:hypothetical protein
MIILKTLKTVFKNNKKEYNDYLIRKRMLFLKTGG